MNTIFWAICEFTDFGQVKNKFEYQNCDHPGIPGQIQKLLYRKLVTLKSSNSLHLLHKSINKISTKKLEEGAK